VWVWGGAYVCIVLYFMASIFHPVQLLFLILCLVISKDTLFAHRPAQHTCRLYKYDLNLSSCVVAFRPRLISSFPILFCLPHFLAHHSNYTTACNLFAHLSNYRQIPALYGPVKIIDHVFLKPE